MVENNSSDNLHNESKKSEGGGQAPLVLGKKVSKDSSAIRHKEENESKDSNDSKESNAVSNDSKEFNGVIATSEKKLWLALVLSIFPGLGHFYLCAAVNGTIASFAMAGVFVSGLLYFNFGLNALNGMLVAYTIFSILGAWFVVYFLTFVDVFRLYRKGVKSDATVSSSLWSMFVVSTLATTVMFLSVPNVYIARAGDNAMLPIVGEGDYYLYNFDTSQPEKGDVVMVRNPVPSMGGPFRSLRVMALEREQLKVEGEIVYVNGKPFLRTRKLENSRLETPDGTGSVFLERYSQGTELVQYDVIELTNIAPFDSTRTYFVPPENFFAMGDNRDSSLDSRMSQDFGFLPVDSLVGRPLMVIYSEDSNRLGKLF